MTCCTEGGPYPNRPAPNTHNVIEYLGMVTSLVAVRLIASDATARKGIVLADPMNVTRENIGGSSGYRIGVDVSYVA
jgi:hypothetical protein